MSLKGIDLIEVFMSPLAVYSAFYLLRTPLFIPQYYGLFPKEYLARKRKNPGRIGYLLRVLRKSLESAIVGR